MNSELPEHLQAIVDTICESGCNQVNRTIEALENKGNIEDTVSLTDEERVKVLRELKNIMSVYKQ